MNEVQKARKAVQSAAESSVLDDVKERFSNIIDEARDKGEELIEEAKDRGAGLLEEAQDTTEELYKNSSRWIRKNPGPAIALAVAAGLVLYAVLSRDDE